LGPPLPCTAGRSLFLEDPVRPKSFRTYGPNYWIKN
jgi:hypothetical protein